MAEPQQASAEEAAGPSLRRSMLRSAAHFSVATMASQASGLIRSLFVMALLGPAAGGVWIGLQLIVTYGGSAHLGAVNGMHRHVPMLRGRGDEAGAEEVKRTTFTFSLLMGALLFAIVAGSTVGLLDPLGPLLGERGRGLLAHLRERELRGVVLGIAAALPLNLVRAYYTVIFRAENRFREASHANIAGSVVGVASLLFIKPFGLAGVVWGMLALLAAETLWLAALGGAPRLGLRWRVLRDQVAVGLVTVVVATLSFFFCSIDRTLLFEHFTAEPRGLYQPALLAATFFSGLSQIPNSLLYPRLSERYGRTGRPTDLLGLVEEPLRMVSVAFALVAGAAALATPALLRLVLPAYVEGGTPVQIAVWGLALYSSVGVVTNLFLTLNRQWVYLALLGLGTAVSYGAGELLVGVQRGLPAIALGTGCGYGVFALGTLVAGWVLLERPGRELLSALGTLLLPPLWAGLCSAAIGFGLGRLVPLDSLPAALGAELLFAAASLPMVLPLLRRLRARG